MRGRFAIDGLNMVSDAGKTAGKKGRDIELVNQRKEVILYRYYYYSKLKRMRYDDVIPILKSEFFLSNRTIIDIINKEIDMLKDIYKQQATINELQKKFTFINWKI